MTLTEIAELVSKRQDSPRELVWGVLQDAIDIMVKQLDRGEEIKIRGLGTIHWVPVKASRAGTFKADGVREYAAGWKLKFTPSYHLRRRKSSMPNDEEGMTKYGVVTEQVKEATEVDEGPTRCCPVCLEELDSGGACPVHGTEPFEKSGD